MSRPLDLSGTDVAETDRKRVEAAADVAVADIEMLVKDLGATEQEAHTVQQATRLGFLGRYDQAMNSLVDAGFEEDFAQDWVNHIRERAQVAP